MSSTEPRRSTTVPNSPLTPRLPSGFVNGSAQKPAVSRKSSLPSIQTPNMATANGTVNDVVHKAKPVRKKALTAAQQTTPPGPMHASPFEIMASRIANRVAEMAENISFVEKPPYGI